MRNLKCVFMLSLVLMFFAGCEKMEIQPDPLNAADDISLKSADDAQYKGSMKHCVPFKGEFQVYVSNIIHPGPPPKIQEAEGFGKATHLGKAKVYLKQWWMPPMPPPTGFPWAGTGWGEVAFTAANGDILKAVYDDAIGKHVSKTLVFVSFTGHFKDGGTGRFKHAKGEFRWDGVFNPLLNEGTTTLTGNIKYSK